MSTKALIDSQQLIGRPYFPPYWALGFHLCRWGYNSANATRMVVERMRELEIPQVDITAPPTLLLQLNRIPNGMILIT